MEIKCRDCGVTKDISEFYRSPRRKCGHEPNCKLCRDGRKYETRRKRRVEYGLKIKFPTLANRLLMEDGFRYCPKCKNAKELWEFYKVNNRNHYSTYCKTCQSEFNKEVNAKSEVRDKRLRKNKERSKEQIEKYVDSDLKRKYGISLDDYNRMLLNQDFKCDICALNTKDNAQRFCVDHDHKTGKVRGLLCSQCNFLLGCSYECPEILSNAVIYLKKHNGY